MDNERKAKAVKLAAKIILKLTGLELLGEGGEFIYEMGKDYLPNVTKNLIDATIDSGVDFFSDEAGDFAKNYLTKREKYVNFHLARAICKVWEENLTASLPINHAANSKYFLLPQDSFQDFSDQIEFFIKKFKEAQKVGNEHLLIELFYDKDKSEEGFYDAFFAGVQNEASAEDAYWTTLEKTLRRWSIVEGKFRYEWKDGFPEDFSRELKKFLFGNLRLGLKEIFEKNEEFRNAFNCSATFLIIKSLQNLPEKIKDQIENAQSENRFNFSQIQERFSRLEMSIKNISRAISLNFDYAFNPQTVIGTNPITQEANEVVKQILEILKNQSKSEEEIFKGFHKSFPRVPNFFTGRKQVLEDLDNTLKTQKQASFYGTHGLGKTRTAIEYAFGHKEDYDFILFISATKGNFENRAVSIASEFSEKIKNVKEMKAGFNLFLDYLEKHNNWLIICDNVEDISEVIGKIPKHFNGNVIYTSNLREINKVASPVIIEAMSQDEAELTLLRRKMDDNDAEIENISTNEREFITKIVEKIGTLPIGLNLAGAYIFDKQLNFQEYFENYEAFEEETLGDFDIADYYGAEFAKDLTEKEKSEYKGIAGVFLLSYSRIIKPKDDSEKEKLVSAAIKVILSLSIFLAPEKVPEEIWQKGLPLINENLERVVKDRILWLEVIERLTQAAFFIRNPEQKTFTTHRLILRILNKRLNKKEKSGVCSQVLEILVDLMPKYDYFNKEICERFYKHVENVLENATKLSLEKKEISSLYYLIAIYQKLLGNYRQAEAFYQRNLELTQIIFDYLSKETAISLSNLGEVYRLQGRNDEAIEKYEEALRIDEKTIGKKCPNYAIHLNNLALAYYAQDKYDEAIKIYKEVLQTYKITIGKKNSDYAAVLNNLGSVYYSQGKYGEAIEKHQEALQIRQKTPGKEHPYYTESLNNLGTVYCSQGKYNEALEKFKEALQIDEKIIGKEHPGYAVDLNNLANTYYLQGEYEKALPMYEEALRIWEATLPENHPNIRTVKEILVMCRKKLEKN